MLFNIEKKKQKKQTVAMVTDLFLTSRERVSSVKTWMEIEYLFDIMLFAVPYIDINMNLELFYICFWFL